MFVTLQIGVSLFIFVRSQKQRGVNSKNTSKGCHAPSEGSEDTNCGVLPFGGSGILLGG